MLSFAIVVIPCQSLQKWHSYSQGKSTANQLQMDTLGSNLLYWPSDPQGYYLRCVSNEDGKMEKIIPISEQTFELVLCVFVVSSHVQVDCES